MSINKRKSKKAKNGYTYQVELKEYHYSKSGFLTKKEAIEHQNIILAQIAKDGYLKRECKLTLNEVYQEFLKVGASKCKHNTILLIKRKYSKHIQDTLGDKPITKINYKVLQEYFNSISNQGKRNNELIKSSLNKILEYAIKNDYISNNPLKLVDIKGVDTTRDRQDTLSYDELINIVSTLKEKNKFRYDSLAIAVMIGYYTGMRIGEIFALDKKDFDFTNDTIDINKQLMYSGLKKSEYYTTHNLKTSSSKAIIPLATPLKQVLIDWFSENPYDKVICDGEGYYLSPDRANTSTRKIAKDLDIDFHFHMLRHTYITNLVENDVDVKTVQELARHASFNTTMSVYTHIKGESKKQAINNVFKMVDVNFASKSDIN